jgi:hypothetical protein
MASHSVSPCNLSPKRLGEGDWITEPTRSLEKNA